MKRFCSCTIIALLILAAALTAGCSSVETASQTADTNMCVPLTSETGSEPIVESSPAEGTALSGWTVAFKNEISHATNIAGFLNEEFGITVGYSGEVHYTNDGGQTWPEGENSSMCLFCLDIVNENLAWAGGNGSNMRMSSDGGKTWSAATDLNIGANPSNIDFIDDTTGWIASLSGLASTKDGGKSWSEIPLPEGAESVAAISLRTSENGYLLSHDGMFFITVDGGATWSKQDLGFKDYNILDVQKQPKLIKINVAVADIHFTDENNGMIVFTGSAPGEGSMTWCLSTSDGGANWDSELIQIEGLAPSKVFISDDGKYLTLSNLQNKTFVLKRKE